MNATTIQVLDKNVGILNRTQNVGSGLKKLVKYIIYQILQLEIEEDLRLDV